MKFTSLSLSRVRVRARGVPRGSGFETTLWYRRLRALKSGLEPAAILLEIKKMYKKKKNRIKWNKLLKSISVALIKQSHFLGHVSCQVWLHILIVC